MTKSDDEFLREAFTAAKEDINADDALMNAYYGDTRPRARINGTVENKYGETSIVGVSVPIDATDDEKAAILESVMKGINDAADFSRLPREEKLEFYLRDAYKALRRILDIAVVGLNDVDWTSKQQKELMFKISEVNGIADMACILIPREFTTVKEDNNGC